MTPDSSRHSEPKLSELLFGLRYNGPLFIEAWQMAESLEEQYEAMQEAIAEAMTSLATGPLRDGYAYTCLERVSNPASEPKVHPRDKLGTRSEFPWRRRASNTDRAPS